MYTQSFSALATPRRILGITLILLQSAASATTRAQSTRLNCENSEGVLPTTLTVEGGGSLGVYEAGMTYVLVEVFRHKWLTRDSVGIYAKLPRLCLSASTGASAGNINSFLAAMSWCSANRTEVPEASLFWSTWTTTGFTQLFLAPDDSDGGLFSRRHFDGYLSARLRSAWARAGWIPGCEIDFGATVTRLFADSVRGAGSIRARNQRLASAFTISGLARDSTPIMRPFVPREESAAIGELAPLLTMRDAIEGVDRVPFETVLRLIEMSSGYPVAFKPLPLQYCTRFRTDSSKALSVDCTDTTTALALDGGVFDNGPISLAYSLFFENHSKKMPVAIYLSPDRRRLWPGQRPDVIRRSPRSADRARPYGLEEAAQLVSEAVPTARQYELQLAGRLLPNELLRQALERDLATERTARQDLVTANDSLQRGLQSLAQTLASSLRREDSLLAIVTRLCTLTSRDTLAATLKDCPDSMALASLGPDRQTPTPLQQGLAGRIERHANGEVAIARIPLIPPTSLSSISDTLVKLTPNVRVRNAAMELLDQQFHSTARWHPLAGDWLASFGAFLGRPLREYDFYVGMYDALFLIADDVLCADYAQDGSEAAKSSRRTCVSAALAALLQNPPLPLGDVAPRLLSALYRDEFGVSIDRGTPAVANVPLSPSDSSWIVMDAVRHAMYAVRMQQDTFPRKERFQTLKWMLSIGHCQRPGIFNSGFCDDRIVAFFDALAKQDTALRILERWHHVADCDGEGALLRPEQCRAEPRFFHMTKDPEGTLYDLTRQVLGRLETVTPKGGAPRRAASALLFLHGSSADRHRRGWDLGETALPENLHGWSRGLFYALPNSVLLTPNIVGFIELGWEGRRHIGTTALALALPFRLRPFTEIGSDGTHMHTLAIPGARLEYKAGPYNTRVGVEEEFWFRPHDGFDHAYDGRTSGFFVSAFGKVNLLLTGVPTGLTYYRQMARIRPFGHPAVLSAGIGDLNGDIYWLWRLFRG